MQDTDATDTPLATLTLLLRPLLRTPCRRRQSHLASGQAQGLDTARGSAIYSSSSWERSLPRSEEFVEALPMMTTLPPRLLSHQKRWGPRRVRLGGCWLPLLHESRINLLDVYTPISHILCEHLRDQDGTRCLRQKRRAFFPRLLRRASCSAVAPPSLPPVVLRDREYVLCTPSGTVATAWLGGQQMAHMLTWSEREERRPNEFFNG